MNQEFESNYGVDLRESSLPIQLDNVDQCYYDFMKKLTPQKLGQKSANSMSLPSDLKTSPTISCCRSICNTDSSFHLTRCCNAPKFQHILHHLILILLGISIALSILLLLLGIFLNCRACLTTGCILGIASFGALLHGCLRHRSLPNSSMPIILSASCMYPIGGNIPMSPNHLHRKQHCQQQQQQYESQPRTLLMKPLTRHYFIPEDAYFTSDHCYHVNSDNRICNCGKTTERWNKRNLDYLLQINQLQASNDFKSTLLQENENAEYPSNTSPSLAITVSVAASAPSSAVQDNNNTANEHSFEPRNKLTNSVPCKLCRINSYPRHYVYQSEYANKLEKCLEYQAHGSCTYKDTDLNKEHYVKNSFHSNNINNWSTIDAPNSSSVGIIEKPLQSTHSHSLVLNLTSEVKNNPQNSNKKDKPSIENDLLHVNNTDLKFNLSHGRHDCCCHQFGFPQSTSHGSINQDCIEHTDKSSKYPHSLLIYHKPRITSKTLASGNCLNFLNELHHVNHQTQVKHSNERFNREHDGDVFGPRVWQNWKSWVD